MYYQKPHIPETAEPCVYTRNALRRHGVCENKADVTDIAMIGALFNLESNFTRLSIPDDAYAAAAIEAASAHNVKIAHNARLHMVGQKYGRDFLRGGPRAQMAVFCHIPYDPKGKLRMQAIDASTVKQSPLCDVDGIWHKRMRETGIRWAFNVYGDGVELPTPFLARPPYSVLASNLLVTQTRRMDFIALAQ